MLYRLAARSAAQSSFASAPPDRPAPITLALHGHGVELSLGVPPVRRVVQSILHGLIEPYLPGEPEVRGAVLPFREQEVVRHLSPDAVRVEDADLLLELYREPRSGERVWLVDERWGICEMNLLRRTWRSWVLENPSIDAVRLFEAAVMWPMAQLLRPAGLHLIPAAAIGRNGRGALVISPFDVGPEIAALGNSGVGVIGQRWVALRAEDDGRVSLLSVPGRTEDSPAPRLLSAGPMGEPRWIDLADGRPCHHAFCELVLLVEPMRRSVASARALPGIEAREQLKQSWPIPQLSGGQSATVATNLLAASLSRTSAVHRVRLSRDGDDLARLLVRPALAA